jgi:hypothetical protein
MADDIDLSAAVDGRSVREWVMGDVKIFCGQEAISRKNLM